MPLLYVVLIYVANAAVVPSLLPSLSPSISPANTVTINKVVQADHVINLAEVQLFSNGNQLSPNLLTFTSSSTYSSGTVSSFCNDGIFTNYCHSSLQDLTPSIVISTSQVFDTVVVFNRADCCQYRICNASITVNLIGQAPVSTTFPGVAQRVYAFGIQSSGAINYIRPTAAPTFSPSKLPSNKPTSPTALPSMDPSISLNPSASPTNFTIPPNMEKLFADVASFSSLGSQYFNKAACVAGVNIPHILINNSVQLRQLISLRNKYSKRKMVYFELTARDVRNSSGFFPAYMLTAPLTLGSNISCTYIAGQGVYATSILVKFPGIDGRPSLSVSKAHDLIIVDATIDRWNASWNDAANLCSTAVGFPNLVNRTVLKTPDCVAFLAYKISWNSNPDLFKSIQLFDVYRTHVSRINCQGGVAFFGGGNSTISSSDLSGIGSVLALSNSAASDAHQLPYSLSSFMIAFNNTMHGWFASAVHISVVGTWIHHNYLYELGGSGVTLYNRKYTGFSLVEYNHMHNVSIYPGSGDGAAGIYLWGYGWSAYTNYFKNNWIFVQGNCFYYDGTTSNQWFENNVCYSTMSVINNGRYNIFKNNVYLSLWKRSYIRLGDINLSGMQEYINFTPMLWQTCANAANLPNRGALLGYIAGMPWAGHVYPNGTQKSALEPWNALALERFPNWKWSEFCTPKTAGPKKLNCSDSQNTYYNNGTAYPFPCELFPSNNRFGSDDYVGFTVIYNITTYNFLPGYGAGPCNITKGQTWGCDLAVAPGWAHYFYDSRQKMYDLNWFNITWYSLARTESLFGTYLPGSKTFLNPQNFVILPGSKLAVDNPALLSIRFSEMGLLVNNTATHFPTIAPSTTPTISPSRVPTSVPTLRPTLVQYKVVISALSTGDHILNLAEVQLFNGGRMLNRSSLTFILSSTYSAASNCNDGILDNFCHTSLSDLNPTLTIQAGSQFFDKVVVYNRVDACCKARIKNATFAVNVGGSTVYTTIFPSLVQLIYTFNVIYPSAQPTALPALPFSAVPSSASSANPFVALPQSSAPIRLPSSAPSRAPTMKSTSVPSPFPWFNPRASPTISPTTIPTAVPSTRPTVTPTAVPSKVPIAKPSSNPTISPTSIPTAMPSAKPTGIPSAGSSKSPTFSPKFVPTALPTKKPTAIPSIAPSKVPVASPSLNPSKSPTSNPVKRPTVIPSQRPTVIPSKRPTVIPSRRPTAIPSIAPSKFPIASPSLNPSKSPTSNPIKRPTVIPSRRPTATPSKIPIASPSLNPSKAPTSNPIKRPTAIPSRRPTVIPSIAPSRIPIASPSLNPTKFPTFSLTKIPTVKPSTRPTSAAPSRSPTAKSTTLPATLSSTKPTFIPSISPSKVPIASSSNPTKALTKSPTKVVTTVPSRKPTVSPTVRPSSAKPSSKL